MIFLQMNSLSTLIPVPIIPFLVGYHRIDVDHAAHRCWQSVKEVYTFNV